MRRQLPLTMIGLPSLFTAAFLLSEVGHSDDAAERETAPAVAVPAATIVPASPALDLSGRWLLTLPAGYQYRITFERQEDGRYRVPGSLAFAGIYRMNNDQLLMDEPVNKRLTVFTWKIHNANSLTLIDETGRSGANYAGATLGRQVAWEGELARTVPRPVVPVAAPRTITLRAGDNSLQPLDRMLGRNVELEGKAFNDAEHGPYIEDAESIVFIAGLDAWPEEVLKKDVVVKGTLRADQLNSDGERLRIHVLDLDTYRATAKE